MAEHPAVRAILAPYDSGHRGLRMGAGPDRLMEGGLPEMLRSAGRPSLSFVPVLPEVDPPAEVATAPEGGLGAEDLKMALGLVQERFAIAAAGIASYDPAFDADGRVLAVALACAQMPTGPEKPAV